MLEKIYIYFRFILGIFLVYKATVWAGFGFFTPRLAIIEVKKELLRWKESEVHFRCILGVFLVYKATV